ncbi:hypothetical protein IPG36_02005 [bacterium]|nr:MAG: hypothetical protein IPG36_02005 [bacterium]
MPEFLGKAVQETQISPVEPEPLTAPDDEMTAEQLEYLRSHEAVFKWQASEFVHHRKSIVWYGVLALIAVGLLAVAIWLHYWLEIGLISVMVVAIIVYARKPPRTLAYEVSPQGITIDGKLHSYDVFRSFGVLPDQSWHTIDLEPAQRLMPRMAILFDEQDFDQIIGHLELHLPRVDRMPDLIERVTRLVRF